MSNLIPTDPWSSKKIIRSVRESLPVPIRGSIRLGTQEENGRMRNEPYFVIDDLPEVKEVYGEKPTHLDILFPLDDIEKVAPSEYQMWAGGDKGMLVCSSDGPGYNGEPGEAIWRARDKRPPENEITGERNPITGCLTRMCRGQQCVDWVDQKGRSRCSQIMRMLFLLPRVSRSDVYLVTVRSWKTIRSVYSWLFHCQNTGIPLYNRVFTLYKEEQTVTHYDAIQDKEFRRNMPITLMRPNDSFMKEYGQQVLQAQKIYQREVAFSFPEVEDTQLLPPARDMSHTPALTAENEEPNHAWAEELLQDPEIQDGFRQLEVAMKKSFPPKARLISILKKEGSDNIKNSVLTEINLKLRELQGSTPKTQARPEPVTKTNPAPDKNISPKSDSVSEAKGSQETTNAVKKQKTSTEARDEGGII